MTTPTPSPSRPIWLWVLVSAFIVCAFAGVRAEHHASYELDYAQHAPTRQARVDALGFAASNATPWGGASERAQDMLQNTPNQHLHTRDTMHAAQASSRHLFRGSTNLSARVMSSLCIVLFFASIFSMIAFGFQRDGTRTSKALPLGICAALCWSVWLIASYGV